ncbi:MAG: zinc ribbon domain-containing protein [Bacteroidota bacterium]
MPIYDYRCSECQTTYDVYFKGKEDKSIVACPKCQSKEHVKLVSVPGVAVSEKSASNSDCCEANGGQCCGGGMCGMN